MFRLLPRDENFFDLFEQQAGHIVSASRVLEELTLDYPSAQAKVERIRQKRRQDTESFECMKTLTLWGGCYNARSARSDPVLRFG